MNRYDYQTLRKAVEKNPTKDNINALGEWFCRFGWDYWNGEYFDADGVKVYPVVVFNEFKDDYTVCGYEAR